MEPQSNSLSSGEHFRKLRALAVLVPFTCCNCATWSKFLPPLSLVSALTSEVLVLRHIDILGLLNYLTFNPQSHVHTLA